MDELDKYAKINKEVAVKYAFKEVVKALFIYSIITILYLYINPSEVINNIIIQYKILFVKILILISVFQIIYNYKWMKNRLDLTSVLRVTKKDTDPVLYMQNLKYSYQTKADIAGKKLEIIKSFSVIPLLTYFFNIYAYIGDNKTERFTNIFSSTMIEILLVLAVISTIVFSLILRIIYQEYKDNKEYLCKVETELMNYLRSEN